MKRILDSSKTIKKCVAGNSKSREYNCAGKYNHERRIFEPYRNLMNVPRRSLSAGCTKFKDDLPKSDDFNKVHPLPERLCMYWRLDEENKRKVSDPSYVKQAVRETFMQRAHGAYNYRRPTHFPVHTSVSHKATYAPTQKQASSKTPKPKPSKPPPEKHIPKPQVPKRKRFIDTAQPVRHFISKAKILQDRRARLGAELKESSEAQLEAMRKKLYDPKPAVLEYLMEKHGPRLAGYQLKTRKEKYQADTVEPPPPFVQRVFGWRKDSKKNTKEQEDVDDDISITPRAIEIRKPSAKQLSLKRTRKKEESAESSEDGKPEKRKSSLVRSWKTRNEKKPSTNEERRAKRREAQENEDREAIINKIKNAATASPRPPHTEYRSIKTQVRDIDLTPQIYPRGSLSLRKSYLPISPCRQAMVSNAASPMTPKVVVPRTAEFAPTPAADANSALDDSSRSKSLTGSIVNTFKSLFHKIRRPNSD